VPRSIGISGLTQSFVHIVRWIYHSIYNNNIYNIKMLNMWSNYEKQERLFNNVVEIMIFGIYNEPDNFI